MAHVGATLAVAHPIMPNAPWPKVGATLAVAHLIMHNAPWDGDGKGKP
jgi:hypothetical protein